MKDTVRDKSASPEIVTEEEHVLKEQRIQNSTAGQEALARKTKAREKGESAAYKSRLRALNSMQGFFATVTAKKKSPGWNTKFFDNPQQLERDSDEFVAYCLEHEIIPSWNLFAEWVGCDVQTLYAEESLSTKSADILKKLRNRIFTILEQFSLQTEGNPASPIFHEKAQYGLSDQQPLDINVHTDAPRQMTGETAKEMIDLLPDEVHEK